MSDEKSLPVTYENTMYFISRGYHWSRDGHYLTKQNKVIHLIDGVYEYAEVDNYGRRLFVKIITESKGVK